MSVGAPGGYRWVSWRPRYSPELVASLLPIVWGMEPSLNQEGPVDRCVLGAGTCTHTCDEDKHGEGCVVDGNHKICAHRHGGHAHCGKCICVDPGARRTDDGRESDMAAMRVDIERGWVGAEMSVRTMQTLALRHAAGLTQQEIADAHGVTQQTVSLRLKAGHMAIADFLNGDTE